MKKVYVKPELEALCFDLDDIIAASTGPQNVLDPVADGFEKMTDGVLNFFYDLGNGI